MTPYSYLLLRYVHDPLRQESVNVGILLFSYENKFLKFVTRDKLNDFEKLFFDFSSSDLRRNLKHIENAYTKYAEKLSMQFALETKSHIKDIAQDVLPLDASSLQWGRGGSGLTTNLMEKLEDLSIRFVQQPCLVYSKRNYSKTDKQVWNKFSQELKKRNILGNFKEATLSVNGITETYEHTFKNGKLHCLQPLSLDLSSTENIKDKAFKEKGRYNFLSTHSNDAIKIYYLLATPKDSELQKHAESVKVILQESGEDVVFFNEEDAASLPTYLTNQLHLKPVRN